MIIFERLQLYNWGPYRANEFALDAPIADFVGENGSGKTHILDAIVTALNLPEMIYEGRDVGSFQRNAAEPAFVLLTIRNPLMSGGRRAFVEFSPKLTIVVRVRANMEPTRQYSMLDGDVNLKAAIDLSNEGRVKWFRTFRDYEGKWERAGYPHLDRAMRMLHHERPKEVRRSNPRGLYNLFERLTNNAENVQKLVEALEHLEESKALHKEARGREDSLHRELIAAETEEEKLADLARRQASLIREERLLLAARYKAARAALRKAKAEADQHESRKADLVEERQRLLAYQPQLQRQLDVATTEAETFEKQRQDAAKRKMDLTVAYGQAEQKARQASADDAELAALTKLPSTRILRAELAKLEQNIGELNSRKGSYGERIRHVEELLHYAKKGLPPEVVSGVKALEEHGIKFEKAWELLPRSHGRNFEEAVSDARYGILLTQAAQQAQVVELLAEHRYPGPISTLSKTEYVRRATEWSPKAEGYETKLGVHVLQGKPPVLNPKLIEEHRRTLTAQKLKLETELEALEEQLTQLAKDLEVCKANLENTPRRDQLVEQKPVRAEALAEFEDMKRSYPGQIAHLEGIERTAAEARGRFDSLDREAKDLAARLLDIQRELETPSTVNFVQLEQDISTTWEKCQSFFEDVKDEVLTIDHHHEAASRARKSLENKNIPTPEEMKAKADEVARTRDDLGKQGQIVSGAAERLAKAELNHQGLEEKMRSNIMAAHARVQKDVEAFAEKVGFKADLKLRFTDEKWHLDYKVAFQKNEAGEWIFRPINNKADSTGEGAIAALVLCLAMSDPTTAAWYLLDEPAQNFSPKNVVNMFRVFGHTNAQIIMTSARFDDYPQEMDVWQHTLGELVNGNAPRPEKYRYNSRELLA